MMRQPNALTPTPIERLSQLVIGSVESVSSQEVRVLLELDAPHSTALNTGTPTAFPRLNGYVLIPNEAGATVGYIAWIGIERSPYPKRSGLKDFGLIDLPFPLRKMTVSPVGTLAWCRDKITKEIKYELSRGVVAFPSVGDQVLVPTPEQIAAIVGTNDSERRVPIGVSPMAGNATIAVDPDKLFGRHLAVLGNTGSGKSCTVAGLVRWSLEFAEKAIRANKKTGEANARFIILDPNGEYAKAFVDLKDKVRLFCVPPVKNGEKPFSVPAWMWNSHEWAAVMQAQPGTQRPLLMQALRNLRSGNALREPIHTGIARQIRLFRSRTAAYIADGSGNSYTNFPYKQDCFHMFKNLQEVMDDFENKLPDSDPAKPHIQSLINEAKNFYDAHASQSKGNTYYTAPNIVDFNKFIPLFDSIAASLPSASTTEDANEDAPILFDVRELADHVEALSADSASNANIANFISFMTLRIRSMLSDRRLATVIAPENPSTFDAWLTEIIGDDGGKNGQISIIDLSLVPSEVMHIVIAVLGRLIFEALHRYQKKHKDGLAIPTTLILEEAHNFIKRGSDDNASHVSTANLCRETFERIAREGRKFGLGLVLSSQRPSELSPTVLAQCNTFILHRIVNDSDQNLVARLVPDNISGLLGELPSLPSRQAIMLGWATPIPVLVEMNELPENQRPQSADPDFWDVWTLAKERAINWSDITSEWSGRQKSPSPQPDEPTKS